MVNSKSLDPSRTDANVTVALLDKWLYEEKKANLDLKKSIDLLKKMFDDTLIKVTSLSLENESLRENNTKLEEKISRLERRFEDKRTDPASSQQTPLDFTKIIKKHAQTIISILKKMNQMNRELKKIS